MKDRITNSKDKGKESGRITAIIAIGSLVGTFIGGFWLVPALGTEMIFVVTGITVMLTVPLVRPLQDVKKPKYVWSFVILSLITLIVNITSVVAVNANNSHSVDESSISIDTEYGRIIIEDGKLGGEPVRYYKQSGAYSSATYLDEEKKYDLVFNYLKKYDLMFKYKDAKNVAMIGGAAYQYPKYLIKNFKDINIDVIEIDPESTRIAKEYFFLQDLIDEYDPEGKRLGLYNEDGRLFLDDTSNKYDAVLNDAFSGTIPVGTLATKEAAKIIKNSLTSKGVYMSNVLGAVNGSKGKFLRAEVKTLKEVFKYVYVVPVRENAKSTDYVNWMVIATDSSKFVPEDALELDFSDAIVLTDDYNPIDSLVPSYSDE
jgi:spermidine synthase